MPLAGYELSDIDRWALARTADFVDRVRAAYEAYEFHTVFHTMLEFCNEHMSAIYLDVLKDRMYCEHPDDPARRAGQAVMYEALRRLLIAASPILSFTADEAWAHLPRASADVDNVALADFPSCPDAWRDDELDRRMARRLELRSRIKEAIESKRPKKKGEREPGQIGSSQEAIARLTVAADRVDALAAEAEALAELAIVSAVEVAAGSPSHSSGVDVDAVPSDDARCERCWNHRPTVGASAEYPALCSRCVTVVERVGPPAQS
jgi:isoleucyl-tRNA synthetase